MKNHKSCSMLFIASLCLIFASGCWWQHRDKTPPTVSSTDPANFATDVPMNRKIAVTFSEPMCPYTVTSRASFIVSQGTQTITGTLAYTGNTATFTPAIDLEPNTQYTVTVTNSVKDLAGNAMKCSYVWGFTTGSFQDTTAPTVVLTTPAADETAVALNASITATFSETMDPASFTTATFTLFDGTSPVPGTVMYVGITAIFSPAINLDNNTEYTATITTDATDLADNHLESAYVWSFTTGAMLDTERPTVSFVVPADQETDVSINSKITATFSEAMSPLTITTATFTLKQGLTPVTGTVG